jgi:formylglycine-generating enzyme required for sulfatase activity
VEQRFRVPPEKAKALHEQLALLRVEVTLEGRYLLLDPATGEKFPPSAHLNTRDGVWYVWIPPGRFMMGCSPGDTECFDNEKPARELEIRSGFWMGEAEVTQADWTRVMGNNPSYYKGEDRPVETVTWVNAKQYCAAVGGRLPRGAEWEYAARAGSTAARYGELDKIGWYGGNSNKQPQLGKQKLPNAWGLYDMLGNVREWTEEEEVRGGSTFDSSPRRTSRVSDHVRSPLVDASCGFRCVVDAAKI